jgi:hypothetical protein
MNQSPQIKSTLINGEDANPKAVENRLAEETDRWDPLGSVDLGGFQVAPLWWVPFSCLLDPSQLGSTVEYAFYLDILHILLPFADKPLQKYRFPKTYGILSV